MVFLSYPRRPRRREVQSVSVTRENPVVVWRVVAACFIFILSPISAITVAQK